MPRRRVDYSLHQGVTPDLAVQNREDLLLHLADKLTDPAVMGCLPQDADTARRALRAPPLRDVAPAGPGPSAARRRPLSV